MDGVISRVEMIPIPIFRLCSYFKAVRASRRTTNSLVSRP